jgi:DNA-binding beta-propeller fold protein YncE
MKSKLYFIYGIMFPIFASFFASAFPLDISGQTDTDTTTYSFVTKWGSLGEGDGQFDGQNDVDLYNGRVYVADYANHRIQIFDPQGEFITKFGETGSANGQLSGPEGVGVDKESGAVYVADTGNNRIQLFEPR